MSQEPGTENGAPNLPTEVKLEPATPESIEAEAKQEKMVKVRPGKEVPLTFLLKHYNPNCGLCKQGWTTKLLHGVQVPRVCSCCVVRFEKAEREYQKIQVTLSKAITETEVEPAPRPEQVERAERRAKRLAEEVDALEGELAERTAKFERDTADLTAAAKANAAREQDLASELIRHNEALPGLEQAVKDAEKAHDEAKLALQGGRDSIKTAEEAKELAAQLVKDGRDEYTRRQVDFERQTSRLRRDMVKAQRRLATARAYASVGGDQSAPSESP